MKNAKQLPNGWKLEKLGSLLEVCQYGISAPSTDEGEYPMFRMNNFTDGKAVVRNMVYVNLTEKEAKTFTLHKGDILFNRTNSLDLVGKTGLFESDGEYVFASYLVRLRVIPAIADSRFVNYFLNKASTKAYLKKLATAGVSQCNINPRTLQEKVVVPLPPLLEQQHISAVLETWDEAIETQVKLLTTLREQQHALRQLLLAGAKRLPGFIDKWQNHRLGDFATRLTRKNSVRNKNVLTISAQAGLISQHKYFNKNIASEDVVNYYLLNQGDFAYNKSYSKGYPLGAIKRLDFHPSGVVSPLYICFSLHSGSSDFFAHLFESGLLNKGISGIAQEGARNHGLLNVSAPDFFKLSLFLPSLPEQEAIAAVLNTAAEEITLREAELKALREQKHGLMQQLLTGQLRVSATPTR